MPDENKNDEKVRKENIQQNPDHVDEQDQKPLTPEPPQRKDPQAAPESEDSGKSKK